MGIALPLTPQRRRILSYVAIEAANVWAQYSMAFYFSVAFGARDASGQRIVAVPAMTMDEALDRAVYALTPKLAGTKRVWQKYELPVWQNKGHLRKVIQSVGPSVLADVDTALGYPTRVLSDLATMRNFYAHKAELAASKARDLRKYYGITGLLSPDELLCTRPSPTSDVLINEWLADLQAILGLMP